ncbi:spermidine/putrescine ABC transporter substrate-binding protein [Ensifer sp. Root31]|nr:spermidine/putrescine ABC transporter substrate-binding protein [Ensifer sp. Root31]
MTATLVLASAVSAHTRDLTIVSWGGTFQDAQRSIFFKPFQASYGKPVLDESWEGGYGLLQSKVSAGNPNWDVVQVEAEELALGCMDGIYEPIDWKRLGGKDQFLPAAVSDCGVGAIIWSTGIAYDRDRLAQGPTSWADFWDVDKFPGKRGLRKGAKYALEFALLADGVPAGDLYNVLGQEEGVERAFRKLDALKPHIVWWESGAQPLQYLATGEVVMTAAFNGRISGINRDEGKHFEFVFPESIYAIDSWAILKGTPFTEAAMDFIAFASETENLIKLPAYTAYGLPRISAAKLVAEEHAKDLPTTPANLEKAIPLDADFWSDNAEQLSERFTAWLAQ